MSFQACASDSILRFRVLDERCNNFTKQAPPLASASSKRPPLTLLSEGLPSPSPTEHSLTPCHRRGCHFLLGQWHPSLLKSQTHVIPRVLVNASNRLSSCGSTLSDRDGRAGWWLSRAHGDIDGELRAGQGSKFEFIWIKAWISNHCFKLQTRQRPSLPKHGQPLPCVGLLLINTVVNPSRNKISKDQISGSAFNLWSSQHLCLQIGRRTHSEQTRVFLPFAVFPSCPYKTQISELQIARRLVQATPTPLSSLLLKFNLCHLFQMINRQEGSTNSLNNPFWDSEGLSWSRGELG